MYILSIIKNWFSRKEKPKQQKTEQLTQVILFDMVNSEPFNSDDDVEEEDYFEATELQRHIN